MSYINKTKSKLFKLSDKIDEAQDFKGIKLKNYGKDIIIDLDLSQIKIKDQVRKEFDESSIQDLAQSIKSEGLLYPILVMEEPNNQPLISKRNYRLVVGENRFRAFKHLKRKTISARVIEYTENTSQIMITQLTENLQRKNLKPIELANSLMSIKKELNITLEDLSKRIGRSVDQLKKYSRIYSLSEQEKQALHSYTFKDIMNYLTTKNVKLSKSAPGALLKNPEQLSLFQETKNGLKLNSFSLNFKKETKEELQEKIANCEAFLKLAKKKIKTIS